MATSFNLVVLMGYLTADPELSYTPSGAAVTKFAIAVNRSWASGEGQKSETSFIDCDAWGKLAELIAKHFAKGKAILVRGRLKQHTWQDKTTQQRRSKLVVVVEEFQFVTTKATGVAPTPPPNPADEVLTPQPAAPRPALDMDEDVPF